tara:strand:+ start:10037 stop:10783 length:747 start_codon:yes stop_codon:yes gene_type:complete
MEKLYVPNRGHVVFEDIVFDEKLGAEINQFLREYEHCDILSKYNLPLSNKLLLHGKSGCGKTMTARAIARKLGKKIKVINLGGIVSSKLGETSANIASSFRLVESQEAVLFFDEFDSLGKERDYDNSDSGEMKRVVNTMLQLIDSLPKHSIIIAATNQIEMIDSALLRRFELKLEFRNPSNELLDGFYDKLLAKYPEEYQQVDRKYDISYAEAQDIVFTTVKNNIIVSELGKKDKLVQENKETDPCLN